jgi:hypothetical protein
MDRLLRDRRPGDSVYAVTAGPQTTEEYKQPEPGQIPKEYAEFLDVFKD